jgi:Delta7-sterol 5-desaturase
LPPGGNGLIWASQWRFGQPAAGGLLAITTHTGFEGVLFRNRKRPHPGNFHLQIHHRYFEGNFGNLDVLWGKLFGFFHDGTEEARVRMRARLAARRR